MADRPPIGKSAAFISGKSIISYIGTHFLFFSRPRSSISSKSTYVSYTGFAPKTDFVRPPKKKGNPVITRYPPPPGYQGPYQGSQGGPQALAQGAYPQGYQQPNFQQPPAQGYAQQPGQYQAPAYQQQGAYPQAQGYQQGYPAQGYQANQTGYQAPAQGYQQPYPPQQGAYQGYPAPVAAQPDPNATPYQQPAQAWQQPYQQPYPANGSGYGSQPPQESEPPPAPIPACRSTEQSISVKSEAGTAESNGGKELYLEWDDWDFDFDGAIWPKGNELIDPNFSLGVLIWHPPKQVTRALPSTHHEANENALRPPPPKLGNGESVSIYFDLHNTYEAFLNVRETDDWPHVRDDPAFVEFPKGPCDMIRIEDVCQNRYRDWADVETEVNPRKENSDSIMDNLEQALESGQNSSGGKATPSSGNKLATYVKAEPVSPISKSQEGILASLGVTGPAKPVQDTQGPFPPPPRANLEAPQEQPFENSFENRHEPATTPSRTLRLGYGYPYKKRANTYRRSNIDGMPPRANSYGGYRNNNYGPPQQRNYGSMSLPRPPPPPPQQPPYGSRRGSQSYGRGNGRGTFNESRRSSTQSDGSHRTLAGSDFGEDDTNNAATNGADVDAKMRGNSFSNPCLERTESSTSRKRSYDDGEPEEEKLRQQDDMPRNKRRQPQVAAAYG
jgi:hypothetical protein